MAEEASGFTEKGKLVRPGTIVLKEGDTADLAFKLDGGKVELLKGERVVCELSTGTYLGAAAVIMERPQPFTIRGAPGPYGFVSQYKGHDIANAFALSADKTREVVASLDYQRRALQAAMGALADGALEQAASDDAERQEAGYQALSGQTDTKMLVGMGRELLREAAERLMGVIDQVT